MNPGRQCMVRRNAPVFCVKRSAPWRRWLALFAAVCAVSLYSVEATHFHHTLAGQLQCPAGHAVGHSPVNVYTPEFRATFGAQGPCELETVPLTGRPAGIPAYFLPQSHAPPSLTADGV